MGIEAYKVKGFGIVNKAEIDVFLELCCFFYDPAEVGNLCTQYLVMTCNGKESGRIYSCSVVSNCLGLQGV